MTHKTISLTYQVVICFLQEGKDMQFDLFDQQDARGAGDRQCDLEDMIAYEESLLAKVQAGDQAGQEDWIARAKAGEVMRIC
ncbi:hypothetical protein [Nereida ignava]|uniref:hypothetical protein n=1 Tax=Nereida ignava TaxID=282199 RepID=UPI0030F7D49C